MKKKLNAILGVLSSRVSGNHVLYEDEADTHLLPAMRAMREWLASHPRVRLHYLPCYMPQLDPVEKIWWRLKAVVAADRLHGTIDALIDAVKTFFELLTTSEALTLAA